MKAYGYYLLLLFSVFLASVSQIFLKKAAVKNHQSFLQEYLNAPVIIGYALFFVCTILTMLAYRVVPLGMGHVITSAGYIFTTIWGRVFFGEKITRRKIIGLIVIISGILICTV